MPEKTPVKQHHFLYKKSKKLKVTFSSLLFTVLFHIEKVDRFFSSPEAGGAHLQYFCQIFNQDVANFTQFLYKKEILRNWNKQHKLAYKQKALISHLKFKEVTTAFSLLRLKKASYKRNKKVSPPFYCRQHQYKYCTQSYSYIFK